MGDLTKMPNIGKKVEEQLLEAGVETPADLIELGSRKTFERLLIIDESSCINKLYALEGAIQGIRWHHLPEEEKKALKEYYLSLK
ncbi:TfoX/Sxy family protein [Methanolobus profundi]|uniref:DNA transformation protein n=1 Tax=Methanolobus profundi TaxID=487685 RepID=A0A1I4PJA4_9EURY|nr:TfoX/Sxy family protein [Methanolobus profundi]SFM27787.1 DNA transformation protein [Methanolobus profundi]